MTAKVKMTRQSIAWIVIAAALGTAAPVAAAQMAEGQAGSSNPFLGSAPPKGTVSATPVDLSVKEAVQHALQFNLGLLLQEEAVQNAHGARWRALENLLP